jgi:hypothetical protein
LRHLRLWGWLLFELLRGGEGLRETLVEADLIHGEVVRVVLREGWLACLLRSLLSDWLLSGLSELAKEVFLLVIIE